MFSIPLKNSATWLVAILLVTACAKNKVAPEDVEAQAFEDLRTEIRLAIDDVTREEEAVRLITSLQKDVAALRESVNRRVSRAAELNADYDTTRTEFETFFEQIELKVRTNREKVAASYGEFLGAVNDQELERITRSHTAAMKAAARSLQAI